MAAGVYHVHHEHHGIKEKLYVMKEHVSTLTNMLSVCLKNCWKNMVSSNNNMFVKCPKLFILHLHKFQFMH